MEGRKIKEFSYQQKLSRSISRYIMDPWERFKAKYFGIWPERVGKLTELKEEEYDKALDNKNSVFYLKPIDPKLKFKGKLIVLISNRTFSAAVDFATILCDNDLATFVGEPTGGRPDSFGDVISMELPNTGFLVGVSYKIFRRPNSDRKDEISLFPDYEVSTTYEDYRKGIDTQMEWIGKHISELKAEP
ncbi:MAG: hypothetical protein AMJ46_09845 [Latescibacteria bacterium DG_63]|nr:MAG: hypothetical protein AMJ46_09845 [Latescibacteria bacterium DG_63]